MIMKFIYSGYKPTVAKLITKEWATVSYSLDFVTNKTETDYWSLNGTYISCHVHIGWPWIYEWM